MEKKSNWQDFQTIIAHEGITKLYHFTDRDNLASIIQQGGLYSWADCADKGITIANQEAVTAPAHWTNETTCNILCG